MECALHYSSVVELNIRHFTAHTKRTAEDFAKKWIRGPSGEDMKISQTFIEVLECISVVDKGLVSKETHLQTSSSSTIASTSSSHITTRSKYTQQGAEASQGTSYGYHSGCYKKFTSQLRYSKLVNEMKKDAQEASTSVSLRSKSRVKGAVEKSHILPPICVVCGKATVYRSRQGKTVTEKTIMAETQSGGKMQEAARLKNDEDMIRKLTGDLVAMEARYHKSCYKTYCRPTYTTSEEAPPAAKRIKRSNMDIVKDEFYEKVIERRVLTRRESLRLTDLVTSFKETAQALDIDDPDINNMENRRMKQFLTKDYGSRIGIQKSQKHATLSSLVYSMESSVVDMVSDETLIVANLESSTDESSSPNPDPRIKVSMHDLEAIELYHTGLLVNRVLDQSTPDHIPWPPTSADITTENCMLSVPPMLFNLLATIVGANDKEVPLYEVCQVNKDLTRAKILSICQDIVYLASNGTKQTPKSLALGLSVRHLTGSSSLSTLLNRFGHSAGYDTLMRYETALAKRQQDISENIPEGFHRHKTTIFVYDNIDFGEETSSGAGTTHHTNGIMVQQIGSDEHTAQSAQVPDIGKRERSFTPLTPTPVIYYHGKRVGPSYQVADLDLPTAQVCLNSLSRSRYTDTSFMLLKSIQSNPLPGWTGFNMHLTPTIGPLSKIHYLPVIEASSTEHSTIKTILQHITDMADKLETQTVIAVFDQAIYAKVQEQIWMNPTIAERIIVRLGEFHTVMSFLAVLGKRFSCSGLEDILVESGVVALGSMNTVLNGHMYNRAIMAHKLLYEALGRLQVSEFLDTLDDTVRTDVNERTKEVLESYETNNRLPDTLAEIQEMFENHVLERIGASPTYRFWNSYLHMVHLMLTFVRATRESDWDLHLSSLRLMMPFYHAYDRQNYARFTPAYWIEMTKLTDTHPNMAEELRKKGSWTVQRQNQHPFASIACDQAIEQTLNRATKTSGGLTGITLNPGARQRWILAQPQRAAITDQCQNLVYIDKEDKMPKSLSPTAVQRNESQVKSIISAVEIMVNPWRTESENLISLSSGVVADEQTQNDLLLAEERGEGQLQTYIKERFISKEVDIFKPIKALKLKTFSSPKVRKGNSGQQVNILKHDNSIFSRLVVISQTRNLNLEKVLTYSLSPISLPLSSTDGGLAKTDKAKLLAMLEGESTPYETPEDAPVAALMIDAMVMIQSTFTQKSKPNTFKEIAEVLLRRMQSLAEHHNCPRVDWVCDRYLPVTIKAAERKKRAGEGTLEIYSLDQSVPKQWGKFLANGSNKENLLEFIYQSFLKMRITGHPFTLFCTSKEKCSSVQLSTQAPVVVEVPELFSKQEEADTRLVLHALHARKDYQNVIIWSNDTDVACIALPHASKFDSLLMTAGTGNKRRIISLTKIAEALGESMTNTLPALHALSGCDTTSSFAGKGKSSIYKIVKEDPEIQSSLSAIGKEYDIQTVPAVVSKIVCSIYGSKEVTVNKARYDLFPKKGGERNIPPTEDALFQHVKRVNYQTAIWLRADNPDPNPPSPHGQGWTLNGQDLSIVWMTNPVAPDDVLQTIACRCKRTNCTGGKCSCSSSNLPCTDLCECIDCENCDDDNPQIIREEDDSDDSEAGD